MNGKKAKALRSLNPQSKAEYSSAADEKAIADVLDVLNRGGIYFLVVDKDHLEWPAAVSGVRVMNRIIGEGLWPTKKVVTVWSGMDIAIRTKNAFFNAFVAEEENTPPPPWFYWVNMVCPDARIFVLIQDQGLPDRAYSFSVGWRDPHDAPADRQESRWRCGDGESCGFLN